VRLARAWLSRQRPYPRSALLYMQPKRVPPLQRPVLPMPRYMLAQPAQDPVSSWLPPPASPPTLLVQVSRWVLYRALQSQGSEHPIRFAARVRPLLERRPEPLQESSRWAPLQAQSQPERSRPQPALLQRPRDSHQHCSQPSP
jgi:hypothetical protein